MEEYSEAGMRLHSMFIKSLRVALMEVNGMLIYLFIGSHNTANCLIFMRAWTDAAKWNSGNKKEKE